MVFEDALSIIDSHSNQHISSQAIFNKRECRRMALKRNVIAFFQFVERDIPSQCLASLRAVSYRIKSLYEFDAPVLLDGLGNLKEFTEADDQRNAWQPQPLSMQHRRSIWVDVEGVFQESIQSNFHPLVQDHLSLAQAETGCTLDVYDCVAEVFVQAEWDDDAIQNFHKVALATVQRAAEVGLAKTMHLYLFDRSEAMGKS
jgi:hypothetical protein